jgi:POT family proton-dependent oligopeptide transporter
MSEVAIAPEAAPVSTRHPIGFFFIFWGEFAERCSYYGMRAILFLYLTSVLAFPDDQATAIQSYFKAACYLLPLLGGFLADRYFGKYWTIVGFSVPYVLGHFILGIQTPIALFIALALLAGGSGVIKPNISTLMGLTYDQKRPGQAALRTSAFLWFYVSINVGAVISQYGLPWLRTNLIERYHELGYSDQIALGNAYRIAFQFPAWLMVASLAIFAAGKRFYATETVGPPPKLTPEERRQRWQVLTQLFGIFGLMVFWWGIYEQNDNLWTAFARDHIDRHLLGPKPSLGTFQFLSPVIDLVWRFFGGEFAPDGFQFIDPLLIILLVPLFGWTFRKLDPEGKVFRPTRKILAGFLFQVIASGVMALAGARAAGGTSVSAWWIVAGFTLLTVGEILVYGTGLELAYAAAPANMKGFITACFLVTDSLGNIINAWLSKLYLSQPDRIKFAQEGALAPWYKLQPAQFFTLSAGIVLVAAIFFYFVGKRFDGGPSTVSEPAEA